MRGTGETSSPKTSAARRAAPLAALALGLGCGLAPPPSEENPPAAAPAPPPSTPPQALPPAGYALAFEDQFDGNALDTTSWNALSEPRIDAVSTPDAVTVSGGVLDITTYTQGGVHRTGFLTTEGKFSLRYGYFEAKIRFNDSPGSWCAFWLTSPTVGTPLGDPGKAGVEIDVVEHRVTDQGGWDALADMVALNLNWDGYDENKKNEQRVLPLPGGARVQHEWHTYGVLWTAQGYTFYVDGVALWSTSSAISNIPEELRLTCEVDDGGWAGFVPKGGYGARAASTTRMEVDWVRAWRAPP
jgi:beta-glucanase (GH16 family)